MNIFERMRNGELIKNEDPDYNLIAEAIEKAFEITGYLNSAFHNDEQVRAILSDLTGYEIDSSTIVKLPLYRLRTIYPFGQKRICQLRLLLYGSSRDHY